MDTKSFTAPAPRMIADPVPEHTLQNLDYWFGLHTTGSLAGKWRRFPKLEAPESALLDDQIIYGYENERLPECRRTWAVTYRRDLISIIATVSTSWDDTTQESVRDALPLGDYFWVTEISRIHWEDVRNQVTLSPPTR
jgi:hypothetical protein